MDAFLLIGDETRGVIDRDCADAPDVSADDSTRHSMHVDHGRRETERFLLVELQPHLLRGLAAGERAIDHRVLLGGAEEKLPGAPVDGRRREEYEVVPNHEGEVD